MSLVKVSVENIDNNQKVLYEIDKSKSLEENISNICAIFEKPHSPNVYGLKLITTNDGKIIHSYVSESNFESIKDGYFLKLVYSVTHYVSRIFDHINDQFKERSFIDLYDLSVDEEFIKAMVRADKHEKLLRTFTEDELTESEATACLIAIVHLFQKQFIEDISQAFLEKVIKISKDGQSNELVKYALSVIHKILCTRDPKFAAWKEETIKQVQIVNLMNHIKKQNSSDLQYGSLLVINALIRCCKGEKRQQLIKEINIKTYREAIYQHIISPGNVPKHIAHELYMYQTYLLSSYAEALGTPITTESELLRPNEFEPIDSEIKKITILMDFDETANKTKTTSLENLLDPEDVRISLASISSKLSEDSRLSNRIKSYATNENTDIDNVQPSLLTIEALRHYRHYHYKNFYQSQIEECVYKPGIVASSERIVRMLAKILHIGTEPDRNSICYQPTVFTGSSKMPFFFELFSRTMWLLSKTRRDMKASTTLDYEKVLRVLSKQVRLVLEDKPMDFKRMTEKMIVTSYNVVVNIWQKEKEQELNNVLDNNPSVQVLKQRFNKQNEGIIYEQRINYIKNGTTFPKFVDKKITGNFQAKLSNNEKHLLINDYDVARKISGPVVSYSVEDITHLVEGKACPHVLNNSVKDPTLAFSLIINNETYINFKAADRKTASYWMDGFNLLTGKNHRSQYYINEMKDLTKMDLVLHLLDLQNVAIPKRAPPIPKNPFEIRPPIPPKPQGYK